MSFQIVKNKNKAQLQARDIFGYIHTLIECDYDSDFDIVTKLFPNFKIDEIYQNFKVFPYLKNSISISGIGKNILIDNYGNLPNADADISTTKTDTKILTRIENELLHLFKHKIPYSLFLIFQNNKNFYLVTAGSYNKIVILEKSNNLKQLLNINTLETPDTMISLQPLSNQPVVVTTYDNEITGVLYGIIKI